MIVLKKQQVRTLQGSLADPRSYSHYLKDIDVVYLDANFWHYLDMADGDFEQAGQQYFEEKIACVNACEAAGVKQMIYMALDNFPENKYVPHFHAKAKGMFRLRGRRWADIQWSIISVQRNCRQRCCTRHMPTTTSYTSTTLPKIQQATIQIDSS